MKEEIKEILRALEKHDILTPSQDSILKDYITNLQEEIERESKAQVILDNQIAEMWKYKQRNEKAIEYITEDDLFYYGDELYDSYQEIVNILKGDKDE